MAVRTKQDVARALADVADDKCFFCQDGCISKNLVEFASCLNHMSEETYHHHATPPKNDFSNWVRDVLGDDKLANDLIKVTQPAEAAQTVEKRVFWLKKKLRGRV